MNSDPHDRAGDTTASEAMRAALERQLHDPGEEGAACPPPPVPDHALLRRIGHGAYGEVWLARSALGTLRAVKMVFRARFKEDRPYEREFHGILKYEPISRTHEGLVQVLHAGRNDKAGCFYYVMELADDAREAIREQVLGESGECGQPVATDLLNTDPLISDYSPRTLRSELASRPRLPPAEAAQLTLRLAGALAHLHAQGLVHRDIKPGNVIFVGGQPKLADIGLVTDVGSSQSFVGTEGFIPPEGPGTPRADLYGLGKLLYELATGRDRMDFPQLPPGVAQLPEGEALLELNEVITRACAPEPKERYASATELQADLNLFLAGRSLRRARNAERHLAQLKKFAIAACAFLVLAAGAIWFVKNEERHANERAKQATERARVEAESHSKEAALRQRAESAERATEQQLYTALLEQARATVRSGEMGRRVRALDAIRRAAAISNSAELRREVFAALALPDLRYERTLPHEQEVRVLALDPAFERIAVCRGAGPVEIRSVADDRLLVSLPATSNLVAYVARWSRDGRFLAVKRDRLNGNGTRADWRVWEVATTRLMMVIPEAHGDAVAFHPQEARVVAGLASNVVAIWDLNDGREIARHAIKGRPGRLEVSAEGQRFVVAQRMPSGTLVSVYRVLDGAEVVSQLFHNWVRGFDWHVGGRWIAVADGSGSASLLDAETGERRELGRHKAEAVQVTFSPDGAYLVSSSWDTEFICWDMQTMRRSFTMALNSHQWQFRADGRACSVDTDKGVQFHVFERPAGQRDCAEDLGGRVRNAAFSPDGRWLAASGTRRLAVWDLKGRGLPALVEEGAEPRLAFSEAGEIFASRPGAAFRWRLIQATNESGAPRLQRLPFATPSDLTSLTLATNGVVLTGARASRLAGFGESNAANGPWTRTADGVNGLSADGTWLGVRRPFTPDLHIYRMPEMTFVAKLTSAASIGDYQFSPLGDEVATASRSTGLEFWSTTTWERTRALTNFSRLLYTPNARALWLSKDQRTAGLYNTRTLEPLLLLPADMLPLALSGDGSRLAVSVDAQRLQVWDLAAVHEQFRELGLDWEER